MNPAIMDKVTVDATSADGKIVLRANGQVINFDGFLKLYVESKDDSDEDDENRILPNVETGESVTKGEIRPEQHFTTPPPRFTEASLVKKLEELGIGRPSTYASIIAVLQDRKYVRVEKLRFIPEDRGRIVTVFLENFFKNMLNTTSPPSWKNISTISLTAKWNGKNCSAVSGPSSSKHRRRPAVANQRSY